MEEIFSGLIDWYLSNINYVSITVLMTIESSLIPFPSEIVVPPAAWKAAQGELDLGLVLLFSTLGAVVGAIINYYIAFFLGRKIVFRFVGTRIAHMMMINRAGVEKSEVFFRKYGSVSTFLGRLVPAVRQLISLPAGFARMDMAPFIVYTALGAGLWNVILALLGYFLYSQKNLLEKVQDTLSYAFAGLAVVFILILVARGFTFKKRLTE